MCIYLEEITACGADINRKPCEAGSENASPFFIFSQNTEQNWRDFFQSVDNERRIFFLHVPTWGLTFFLAVNRVICDLLSCLEVLLLEVGERRAHWYDGRRSGRVWNPHLLLSQRPQNDRSLEEGCMQRLAKADEGFVLTAYCTDHQQVRTGGMDSPLARLF